MRVSSSLSLSHKQQLDSGSDISLHNYDHKSSKSNLKDRISDMFKRPTSMVRNDSEDGNNESDQRHSYSNRNTPNLSRHASPVTSRSIQVSLSVSLSSSIRLIRVSDAYRKKFDLYLDEQWHV